MIKSSPRPRRRGTVAVLTAISLTVLVMILAMSLDAGLLFAEKRHAQAVADAAAMAGAADLYKRYATYQGNDPDGTASASALAIASSNGYANDGTTSTVIVRTKGQNYFAGPNVGAVIPAGRIEVNVTYNHPRYFSLIFGSGDIPITARAVAVGTSGVPKFGILALAPTGTGLKLTGNGVINVESGLIQVNSSDPTSAVTNLSNASITAVGVDILGGLSGAGTITTTPTPDNVNYNVPPSPDPLWSLPQPPDTGIAGSLTKLNGKTLTDMQTTMTGLGYTFTSEISKMNIHVAEPGTFDGKGTAKFDPSLGNGDIVLFKPGIYYLNEYGVNFNNSALLMYPGTSGGLMFFIDPAKISDGFGITGNGTNPVNLSGIESGTYQGMIIFQSRTATIQPTISITGNGNFTMEGTIYAANGELNLKGEASGNNIGSALVAKNILLTGNGELNVTYSSGKVAPQRIYRLVE